MNFEKINIQPAAGVSETQDFKEQPSSDYQNIRNEAMAMIDQKIMLMKDELGPNALEIAAYETAKDKLNDDQYIINLAKVNNWQKSREQAEDPEEEDKKLARGLVTSVLNLH